MGIKELRQFQPGPLFDFEMEREQIREKNRGYLRSAPYIVAGQFLREGKNDVETVCAKAGNHSATIIPDENFLNQFGAEDRERMVEGLGAIALGAAVISVDHMLIKGSIDPAVFAERYNFGIQKSPFPKIPEEPVAYVLPEDEQFALFAKAAKDKTLTRFLENLNELPVPLGNYLSKSGFIKLAEPLFPDYKARAQSFIDHLAQKNPPKSR